MTHQELFDRWIEAERGLISELSGSIDRDLKELHKEAQEYASDNGLGLIWDGSWFG